MSTLDSNEKKPCVAVAAEEKTDVESQQIRDISTRHTARSSSETFRQNVTRVVLVSTWWAWWAWWAWWPLGAALLAIPLALSATAFSSARIGNVRLLGLLVWLEIVWLALWVLYFLILIIGRVWHSLCRGYHSCGTKYLNIEDRKDPAHDIHKQLTIWYHLYRPKYSNIGDWENFLNDIHKQLTKQHHLCRQCWEGLLDDIHKPLKKWYHLCRQKYLNIESWEDFLDEIRKPLTIFFLAIVCWASVPTLCLFDHDNCTAGWVGILRKVLLATLPITSVILAKSVLIQIIITKSAMELLRTRQEVEKRFKALTLLMEWIEPGRKESIWTTLKIPENERLDFLEYRRNYRRNYQEKFDKMTTLSLAEHIERSKSQLTKEEILEIFDEDGNGGISLDGLMIAAYEIYVYRRDIEHGINGIKTAARSVDRTISGIILIAMALIYTAFFTKHLNSFLTPLWTTFTGISFALQGTVTEFLSSCDFVFSKQPYDVGNRVTIDDKELKVHQIYLLYTVFSRVTDGAFDQIPHSEIKSKWIANHSRSQNLNMTKKRSFKVRGMISYKCSKEIQKEIQDKLEKFVTENELCFRYLKKGIDVTLILNKNPNILDVEVKMPCKNRFMRRHALLDPCRELVWDKTCDELEQELEQKLKLPQYLGNGLYVSRD